MMMTVGRGFDAHRHVSIFFEHKPSKEKKLNRETAAAATTVNERKNH